MMGLSPYAAIILGVVLAVWLGAAIWALTSGQRMRREGTQAQGKLERLAVLLASAPAASIIIHPDRRLKRQIGSPNGWAGRACRLSNPN